jgi:hypothetical protein
LFVSPFRTAQLPHFRVAKAARHGMLMPMPAKTDKPEDPSAEPPHYHGHRMRLRERFRC